MTSHHHPDVICCTVANPDDREDRNHSVATPPIDLTDGGKVGETRFTGKIPQHGEIKRSKMFSYPDERSKEQRDIENAKIAAKALMSVVEQKEKKVVMNGKQYLEFADWQAIAKFFNITTGTEWTRPIESKDKIIGWEARAVAYQNGVIVGGAEAACSGDQRCVERR